MNIIKWFKRFFKKKVPNVGILDLWAEKLKNEYRQERENQRLINAAKREAFDMYQQWESRKLDALLWKTYTKDSPYVMKYNPHEGLGMWISMGPGIVYHYPNDKVKPITEEEYNKIRNEEFERLKLTTS
jgi:hypothetical protein